MNFSKIIKFFRQDAKMTQENLASALSVSPQAVSRWETGTAMPDVSLLPAIANMFNVTTDYLLDVDITKKMIDTILEEAHLFYAKCNFDKAVEILSEALKKYPKSYRIMASLADDLGMIPGKTDEVIEICQTILSECTETKIRDSAVQSMIFAYNNSGRKSKALECAANLSTLPVTKEYTLLLLTDGDEAIDNLHEIVNFSCSAVMMSLLKMSSSFFLYRRR